MPLSPWLWFLLFNIIDEIEIYLRNQRSLLWSVLVLGLLDFVVLRLPSFLVLWFQRQSLLIKLRYYLILLDLRNLLVHILVEVHLSRCSIQLVLLLLFTQCLHNSNVVEITLLRWCAFGFKFWSARLRNRLRELLQEMRLFFIVTDYNIFNRWLLLQLFLEVVRTIKLL